MKKHNKDNIFVGELSELSFLSKAFIKGSINNEKLEKTPLSGKAHDDA